MMLTYQDIIRNISDAIECLDAEEIVEVHNKICSSKIKYVGDSMSNTKVISIWEYTGENDNES